MMDDDQSLKPTRAVAIFPFGVASQPVDGRQADLCRGLAVLVERRLGRLPGVMPLIQNLFISPNSNPARKGWLLTNRLWSLEQALSMPIANGDQATHLLQGLLTFADDNITITMELIDLVGGESLIQESHEGPVNDLLESFFRVLRPVAATLMQSASAGRVVTRLPTRDAEAFELFVLGLAAVQAHAQGMVGSQVPLKLLTQTLEKDGELIEALEELERLAAHVAAEEGEEPRAVVLECLARARAASPWSTGLLALEGLIRARIGAPDEAIPLLEKYLEKDTRGELASQVMTALAQLHSDRRDMTRARKLLNAAITASPENAIAWEELGACHQAAGEARQAEECWRRALQEDPNRARSLVELGRAYQSRGDAARAVPLLERAVALGAESVSLVEALAEGYLQQGEVDRADEVATGWVEEHPEASGGWLVLAKVRHRRSDRAAVERCLAEAARRAGNTRERLDVGLQRFAFEHPFEYAEFRRLSMQQRFNPSEAAGHLYRFTHGVHAHQPQPDVLHLISRLAEAANEPKQALTAWARALAMIGEETRDDVLHLARLYAAADLDSEAEKTLARLPAEWEQHPGVQRLRKEIATRAKARVESSDDSSTVTQPGPANPAATEPQADESTVPDQGFLHRLRSFAKRLFKRP